MSEPKLTLDDLLDRLDKVKRISHSRATARCPAHADKSPSMTITEGHTCILMHCFAGCTFESILAAINVEPEQLLYAEIEGTNLIRKPTWGREAADIKQLNMERTADE